MMVYCCVPSISELRMLYCCGGSWRLLHTTIIVLLGAPETPLQQCKPQANKSPIYANLYNTPVVVATAVGCIACFQQIRCRCHCSWECSPQQHTNGACQQLQLHHHWSR